MGEALVAGEDTGFESVSQKTRNLLFFISSAVTSSSARREALPGSALPDHSSR